MRLICLSIVPAVRRAGAANSAAVAVHQAAAATARLAMEVAVHVGTNRPTRLQTVLVACLLMSRWAPPHQLLDRMRPRPSRNPDAAGAHRRASLRPPPRLDRQAYHRRTVLNLKNKIYKGYFKLSY